MKKTALASVFDKLRDALGAARSELDGVRDNIASLKEYRQKIDDSPVDQATIEARVDAEIKRMQDPMGGNPATAFRWLQERKMHRPEVDLRAMLAHDPTRVLIAVFPNEMRRFMLASARPRDGKGMNDAARAAELAKVDAELQALEAQEEPLVREMEAGGGVPLPRRADASPEILLAPTNELQP
jgi:hypothetical protein